MKKLLTVCLLAFAAAGATGCRSAAEGVKPKLMWLDCSANWVRFSYPDSIRYYVNKCREAGMTALVLDVKGTSSEVVYPSEYAPQVREWKGFTRPDFDFVGTFVDAAHDAVLGRAEAHVHLHLMARRGRGLALDAAEDDFGRFLGLPGHKGRIHLTDRRLLGTKAAADTRLGHTDHAFRDMQRVRDNAARVENDLGRA